MSSATQKPVATLEDLYRVEGKAELIGGRIVHFMPTGFRPSRIAARIFRRLDDYSEETSRGFAFTDNMGFAVNELSSERESFSPDASYYHGPPPANQMKFILGPPTLAVEVRSESDYGRAAEAEMAAKRLDYFQAGTQVVWDVDPRAECIRSYRAGESDQPVTFQKGQIADAEPAVPGWLIAVDDVFA